MSKGHKPGGGIRSRVNVSVGNKTGAPRERIRHAGVAQYGQAQGDHISPHSQTWFGYRRNGQDNQSLERRKVRNLLRIGTSGRKMKAEGHSTSLRGYSTLDWSLHEFEPRFARSVMSKIFSILIPGTEVE